MLQMNVPRRFWSYRVLKAAYLINRLPSRVLGFKSPLQVLQSKSPYLSHLKVFGCSCFVHLPSSQHDKLDSRAIKCIFLGYSQTQKGYKRYDPSLKQCTYQEVLDSLKTSLISLQQVRGGSF